MYVTLYLLGLFLWDCFKSILALIVIPKMYLNLNQVEIQKKLKHNKRVGSMGIKARL